MVFKEFHCSTWISLMVLALFRFSGCSFAFPRMLFKPWHFFKVLALNEAFPFTTNSNFCLAHFLENIAIDTGLASNPRLGCFASSCHMLLVLGTSWVHELLEGIQYYSHLLLIVSLFFSSDSSPSVYKHALISPIIIFPFPPSCYPCSLYFYC